MVFEREQRVEAERLSQVAQRHVLGQYRSVRAPFLREHVQRDADFHGDLVPHTARNELYPLLPCCPVSDWRLADRCAEPLCCSARTWDMAIRKASPLGHYATLPAGG